MNYPKRLIEIDLPIARFSTHARSEKDSRLGHIPRLHIYPAARPVAACRAVLCAAMWPDPADELCSQAFRETAAKQLMAFANRVFPKKINDGHQLQSTASRESLGRWEGLLQAEKDGHPLDPYDPAHQLVLRGALLDFIADFANWDNSTVPAYLETSRMLTKASHEALGGLGGSRPVVVDPFGGGGAIPLEALRIGTEVISSDQNPLAVLIQKVILEYTPTFGSRLIHVIDSWHEWIMPRAKRVLAAVYPNDEDGRIPIAYLWARTILSEEPQSDAPPVEVPLIRSMWLTRKKKVDYALRWKRGQDGHVQTITTNKTYANGSTIEVRVPQLEVFAPRSAREVEKGTAARNSATCPVTGYTTPASRVRVPPVSVRNFPWGVLAGRLGARGPAGVRNAQAVAGISASVWR